MQPANSRAGQHAGPPVQPVGARGAPRETASQAGGMASAPIVVHRLSPSGGRRVTARARDVEQILGVAYNDRDVLEFLAESASMAAPPLLDQPHWVEWRGGRPHQWATAS